MSSLDKRASEWIDTHLPEPTSAYDCDGYRVITDRLTTLLRAVRDEALEEAAQEVQRGKDEKTMAFCGGQPSPEDIAGAVDDFLDLSAGAIRRLKSCEPRTLKSRDEKSGRGSENHGRTSAGGVSMAQISVRAGQVVTELSPQPRSATCEREVHRRYHDSGMCYGDSHAELLARAEACGCQRCSCKAVVS